MRRVCILPIVGFTCLVLARLGHPLFWSDEAETAMYGVRILEHGYPKAVDETGIVLELGAPLELVTRPASQAFIGSPWLQYYVAAGGAALGRGFSDLHAVTAAVRLPFATAGLLAVACWGLLLHRLLQRARLPSAGWLLAFGVLLCLSVNLILHLREARYYALVALELAALARVRIGRDALGDIGPRTEAVATTAILLLCFLTFWPAFAGAGLAIAVDAARRVRAEGATRRFGAWLRAGAPLLAAAAAAVPLALWFRLPRLIALGDAYGVSDASAYLERVALALHYFATREFGLPLLAATLARRIVARRSEPLPALAPLERATDFLLLLVAAMAVAVARVPWLFSRYLVGVGPAISVALILELAGLAVRLRTESTRRRCAAWAAPALLGGAVAAQLLPMLAGRLAEIAVPPGGPMDALVPRLAALAPADRPLVIATNYGASIYRFYLGSRVLVGLPGVLLPEERSLCPDVVVPRRAWTHQELLAGYLARGDYVEERLAVIDAPWNNLPETWRPWRALPQHRFGLLPPPREGQALRFFVARGLVPSLSDVSARGPPSCPRQGTATLVPRAKG